MATYGDLILKYRLFMKAYPFARYAINPVPCAPLDKPLNLARVALVTTADCKHRSNPDSITRSKVATLRFGRFRTL